MKKKRQRHIIVNANDFMTPTLYNTQALLRLAHNAKVYIAARNEEKAKSAITELREKTRKEAIFLKLDLADLKSVKSSAEEFIRCAWSNISSGV